MDDNKPKDDPLKDWHDKHDLKAVSLILQRRLPKSFVRQALKNIIEGQSKSRSNG